MSSNETDTFVNLMTELAGSDKIEDNEGTPPESDELAHEDDEPEVEGESEDTHEPEAEAESEEDEDADEAEEEEEAPEEEPKPKGKKSAQERITEVVTKQRQAERELAAERDRNAELIRRLEALEAAKPESQAKPSPETPTGNQYGLVEPKEDDLDENGESKYPLGSFDPNFMRDINRYDRAVERAYEAEIAEKTAKAAAQQAEEQKIFEEWNKKLNEAEKASPNIREKAQGLVDEFFDADPQHMQVVAQTIMQLDNGPSVLEYLADNLDEAEKITKMPTNRALLYLGRIDGMFIPDDDEDEPAPVKPTKAPTPPTNLARGSKGGNKGSSMYDKMLADFR